MRASLMLSLEHLCSTKIVSSFFNEVLPLIENYCLKTSKLLENSSSAINMDPDKIYNMIYSKVRRKIKCLTSSTLLQKKIEKFIAPLFYEIEEWLKVCENTWQVYDDTLLTILKSIPRCWFPDGAVDREKSIKILIKNSDANATYRFVSACNFCLLDDVLDIWKILPDAAKIYLKYHADLTVTHFIRWLESESKKDCQSFVSWTLASSLWYKNVYILKYVLKTLSSMEKRRHLYYALTQTEVSCDIMRLGLSLMTKNEVSCDIMRLGLSLMTKDEQQLIFKECPVDVFRCIASWPVRDRFFHIVDILWPFLTEDIFCNILNMLLLQIKNHNRDDELLVIFKKFWAESPLSFKTFANNNSVICEPLQFVLKHDLSEAFQIHNFLFCFDNTFNDWDIEFMIR